MEEINITEVYSYFKTKILWIILAIIATVIIGNIYTIITRVPMYQSNTTLVLVTEDKDDDNKIDHQLSQNLIGTYAQIIKSRNVLNQVINNLKLKVSATELSNYVSTSSIESTDIIQITVNFPNAKDSKKITDEVARVFSKEIQDIYHLENITIVDRAELAKAPYNVNYVKDNVIYLLIGLILSFGVVFVMYYFDTSIKSSEDVENKLGLTVIGIVPKEDKE